MLRSMLTYSEFIYSLPKRYPAIQHSTLTLYTIGAKHGRLTGKLEFESDVVLTVSEIVNFDDGCIETYAYSVRRGENILYWYDSQPHPTDPMLASTHPHHKHIPPNIKRHRIPTPSLHFNRPNLPFLIEEVQREVLKGM